MESPGEHLKREREHRGVSLLKIFEATRVPMKYLEAIEADRVEGLPHPTFVKGYIRSYCKVLGLDENDAVLRFEVWLSEKQMEAQQEQGRPRPINEMKRDKASKQAAPRREIRLPANLGKAVVVAAGVVVVILAYTLTKRDMSVPEPQVMPAPAIEASAKPEPSAEAALAAASDHPLTESAASAAPSPAQAQAAPEAQAAPAAKVEPAAAARPEPKAMPAVRQAEPQPEKAPQAEPVRKEAPVNGAESAPARQHILTASARDMVWLKIGIDREEPIEVLLKEGERVTWTASDNISVIIGNAGGVSFTYNGKAIPGLGATGEVVGLKLPSGTSYKIRVPEQQRHDDDGPAQAAPQMSPAINMPEVPAAAPARGTEG